MSLKFSLLFLLLAAALLIHAYACRGHLATVVPLVYIANSCLLLTIGYAGVGPSVFQKQADGRLHPVGWLLFAPYHVFKATALNLYQRISPSASFALVAPNLYLGRRLTNAEARRLQPSGWAGVLDLAGEFPEVRELRSAQSYLALSVLDGTAPSPAQLQQAVAWLERTLPAGPVYVHCALGHGRSAAVVVAFLLATHQVESVEAGEAFVRTLRSGVRLNRRQRSALKTFQSLTNTR